MKRYRNMIGSRGVTLIEAILTVAIIGAGLLGVMYVFVGGQKSAMVTDQTVVASNLAREKMEQIIADRANNGYLNTIATSYSDGALGGNYSQFTRTVTITEVDPTRSTGTDDFALPPLVPYVGDVERYARVTVTVSWGSGDSVTLVTVLANY